MVLVARATVDDDRAAARGKRQLDLPRDVALGLARETMRALASGRYTSEDGDPVRWAPLVQAARDAAVSIPPQATLPAAPDPGLSITSVTVANETSLAAARALYEEGRRPLVLNMANGVVPGGGFLHGSRAQEEYLCRSSALYATLDGDPMYDAHRARGDYESSAWAILSPDVPVFRDDDARLLDLPWPASFLTCAAPVAQRVGQPRSAELMAARIDRVLAIAAAHSYTDLVLGAWGCGAFGNDPHTTADAFHTALSGPHAGSFDRVVFAITDWSPDRRFLGPFRDRFQ